MTVVYIISFLLIAFGIVRILGLTPESIGADVSSILDRKKVSATTQCARGERKEPTSWCCGWIRSAAHYLTRERKNLSAWRVPWHCY